MRLPFGIRPLQLISGLTMTAIVAFAVWKLSMGWSADNFVRAARQLPSHWFIPCFALIPLIGAPISIFLIAAGLKYGVALGMLVTAGCMAVHHLAAWLVAHTWLRERLERWLEQCDYELPSIPRRHQTWFMIVFAAAPGLAYTIKLYAIALTDMPFRKYFWLGWPIHTFSSFLFIAMGGAAGNVHAWVLAAFGICFVLSVGIAAWLKRKMKLQASPEPDETRDQSAGRSCGDSAQRNLANESSVCVRSHAT